MARPWGGVMCPLGLKCKGPRVRMKLACKERRVSVAGAPRGKESLRSGDRREAGRGGQIQQIKHRMLNSG